MSEDIRWVIMIFWGLGKEYVGVQPIGPVLERPIYALDLNLLLDIFKARPGYRKVVKIMQIGFQGGSQFASRLNLRGNLSVNQPIFLMTLF